MQKLLLELQVKNQQKKEEVKSFSADELPRLEPNLKKTETVYSISEGSNLSNYENIIKTITFKSDAKENMLVIFMDKCKKCNKLLNAGNSAFKCVCKDINNKVSNLTNEVSNLTNEVSNLTNEVSNLTNEVSNLTNDDKEGVVRKGFFLEYYNVKYLIHYIDGVNFSDYIIRGCNVIYYVNEEESITINNYLEKIENVSKFPLIRYKKMLNIFITANRKSAVDSISDLDTSSPTTPTSPIIVESSVDPEPIVYGGSECKDNPAIEDLNEAFKDKTKRKIFIKYPTLEERREARLKQTSERLNRRELCTVCNCDVRLGGLSKHLLTIKHKENLEINRIKMNQ